MICDFTSHYKNLHSTLALLRPVALPPFRPVVLPLSRLQERRLLCVLHLKPTVPPLTATVFRDCGQ